MLRTRICLSFILCLISLSSTTAQTIDTIRVGDGTFGATKPMAGTYIIENYRIKGGVEELRSVTTQTIAMDTLDGVPVYHVSFEHASTSDTTYSMITARQSDLSLLFQQVKGKYDSASVAVVGHHISGWVALPDQPVRLINQMPDHRVFPIEGQVPWLFPLLPLKPGYSVAFPHYSVWEGAERWRYLTVVGEEELTINGESFQCWTVDGGILFQDFRVKFWVDKHMMRIVQGIAMSESSDTVYKSLLRVE